MTGKKNRKRDGEKKHNTDEREREKTGKTTRDV